MEVTLSWEEVEWAATVGMRRTIESCRSRRRDAHGLLGKRETEIPWNIDIQGALGELAVAKAFGIAWPAHIGNFHGPDVARKLQVRTATDPSHSLIVRSADADDHVFVLALGKLATYRIVGYVLGRKAKQKQWERAPRGRPAAWFVPQSALFPFTDRDVARVRERYPPYQAPSSREDLFLLEWKWNDDASCASGNGS